jgi:hypothetical protein
MTKTDVKVTIYEAHEVDKFAAGLVGGAIVEVLRERERQNEKWGEQNHPNGTGPVTMPLKLDIRHIELAPAMHLAKLFTASTDAAAAPHSLTAPVTWRHILLEEVFEALAEDDLDKLAVELVQVAAVAVQWREAIERQRLG